MGSRHKFTSARATAITANGADLAGLRPEQHLSPSTFRKGRKLEREGCSYQEIKDEVRRGVAFEQLRLSNASIGDIAEQLGFQEPSAFHRAFKKWTGESGTVSGAVFGVDGVGVRLSFYLIVLGCCTNFPCFLTWKSLVTTAQEQRMT